MGAKSRISWTDATWNPTTGCTRVSAGCDHCYAFALHDRRHVQNRDAARAVEAHATPADIRAIARSPHVGPSDRKGKPDHPLPWPAVYDLPFSTVQLHHDRLNLPLRWREPRRIFVDSMADLFHEDVPDAFLFAVFDVMARAPRHTFQILTKRPERMRRWIVRVGQTAPGDAKLPGGYGWSVREPWPLPNVIPGVSAENQAEAERRLPELMATPAAKRMVSIEPMLGPVDLLSLVGRPHHGEYHDKYGPCTCPPRLSWVIVGGESGPGRRPMDLDWARSVRDQCQALGVPFFFKQANGPMPGTPAHDPELDGAKEFP